MELNLQTTYDSYSNIELLKIVRQEYLYRPEAVAIAKAILNERTVTEEDVDAVDRYLEQLERSEIEKRKRKERVTEGIVDFLQPVINPTEKVDAAKWLRFFLVAAGLYYLRSLWTNIQALYGYLSYDWKIDGNFFLSVLSIVYTPFMFSLLYRRKKWGWILLFSDNVFAGISNVSLSYIFFKYLDIHRGDPQSFVFGCIFPIAFVTFLWRKDISGLFKISSETRKKTAIIVSTASVIFVALAYFFGSRL